VTSELLLPPLSPAARRGRVIGVVLRDAYALRRNPPRVLEVIFWPTLELVVWGYVSVYLQRNAVPGAVAALLGATLLWQVMYRSQGELSMAFLDDVWSRNLLNVFVTPLTTPEYLAGLVLFGAVKTAAGMAMMAALAWLLYGFGVLAIGPALVPYLAVLVVFGWALGVVAIGVVIRFGSSAQAIAWVLSFVFQPFSAVFYPLSVLPAPLRAIGLAVPASHVFENMRAVLAGRTPDAGGLLVAAALDLAYVTAALVFLGYALRHARRRGLLSRLGT